MVRSLLAHATRDIEIDIIDGDANCTRNVRTGRTTALPVGLHGRVQGNTVFTFARFAPPALCGFTGRAIYVENDMVAFGDVAELWERSLGGAAFAAVPYPSGRGANSLYQTTGYMSSVLLFDAARCQHIDVATITDAVRDGRVTYQDAVSLTDRFLTEMRIEVSPLPAMWNDIEWRFDDTKILHYTNTGRRPWIDPKQPTSDTWTEAYLACVGHGDLDRMQLRAARRAGDISTRVEWLPRLPNWSRRTVDRIWQQLECVVLWVSPRLQALRLRGARVVHRFGRPLSRGS